MLFWESSLLYIEEFFLFFYFFYLLGLSIVVGSCAFTNLLEALEFG